MRWVKTQSPAYTLLKVWLEPGEALTAEPGAMVAIRGEVEVETSSGGVLRGIKRALFGGESFFLNTFRAVTPAEVWLAPGTPGDVEAIQLSGEDWVVQDTSYLAHHGDVEVSTAWRGFKGLLAEGELVWLKVSGRGTVWVSSYGGIEVLEVPPGEKAIVDNFHLVAMPASTEYRVTKIGGLKTLFFGGEGLVLEVQGPARLLVQTRILPPLARLLAKYLPRRD